MKKPSLLDRLTGAHLTEEFDDFFEGNEAESDRNTRKEVANRARAPQEGNWEDAADEELSVDVYQTENAVVVKALIAGVAPSNLDINLTRDMVTITGSREDEREVESDGYFQKELRWGSFTRTVLLPEEVDVDLAEAYEKHGVLIIRLPKINKSKQTKLKVKTK